MSRSALKEWLSIPAGLFLLAFAASYVVPLLGGGLENASEAVMYALLNPLALIPGLVGIGLLVYAPVSRARRLRMERITRGDEEVDEPLAAHEQDHGFVASHLWSLLGSGFLAMTLVAVGLFALLTSPATSVVALGWAFIALGLAAGVFPVKWWREWSARQALLHEREEWQLDAPEPVAPEPEVVLDFGEDAHEDEVASEQVEEVTRAR